LSGAIAELNATVEDLSEMMGRQKSWCKDNDPAVVNPQTMGIIGFPYPI
jgi:hypothetical protein